MAIHFDHQDSIDFAQLASDLGTLKSGAPVKTPVYDFTTHRRVANQSHDVLARDTVLVDGILLLVDESIRSLADISVFVDCDAETRLARRLTRDVQERGREPDNIRAQISQQVKPMHQLFVQPAAQYADIDSTNFSPATTQTGC